MEESATSSYVLIQLSSTGFLLPFPRRKLFGLCCFAEGYTQVPGNAHISFLLVLHPDIITLSAVLALTNLDCTKFFLITSSLLVVSQAKCFGLLLRPCRPLTSSILAQEMICSGQIYGCMADSKTKQSRPPDRLNTCWVEWVGHRKLLFVYGQKEVSYIAVLSTFAIFDRSSSAPVELAWKPAPSRMQWVGTMAELN